MTVSESKTVTAHEIINNNMEYVEIDGNIFCALSEKKLDKLSDSEIELLEELCNKGYFFHHQKPELSSIRRNKIYIS